jgi:hypothetical protein
MPAHFVGRCQIRRRGFARHAWLAPDDDFHPVPIVVREVRVAVERIEVGGNRRDRDEDLRRATLHRTDEAGRSDTNDGVVERSNAELLAEDVLTPECGSPVVD